MKTFEEYQSAAVKAPVSLRNNRDRIDFPVMGLQQEAGRIGLLLSQASASSKLDLTSQQRGELKDRLADCLWYVAVLCAETRIPMQDIAAHSIAQLHTRIAGLDPDRR